MESYLIEFKKRETTISRIKQWNERANHEKNDKIDKFIYRWISFNGLYSGLYASIHFSQDKAEKASDWVKINDFCEKFILTNKKLATQIYSDGLKKVFNDSIQERTGFIGDFLENLNKDIDLEEKAMNMILIAYKLRCRLFHGEKNPLLEVDQKVIDAADQVILPIMNFMIDYFL